MCPVFLFALSCNPTFMVTVGILWDKAGKGLNTGPDGHDRQQFRRVQPQRRGEGLALRFRSPLLSALSTIPQVGDNNLQQALRLSYSR